MQNKSKLVAILAVATSAIVLAVLLTHRDADAGEAPSYEDIHKAILAIIYTKDRPSGPAVGSDGITDEEFLQEWSAYNMSLRGKKVSGWVGCLTDIEPPLENVRGDLFNVVMDESKIGVEGTFSDIELTGVNTWNLLQVNSSFSRDAAQKSCWRARIGGTIEQVGPYGRLDIGQGNLEPIK